MAPRAGPKLMGHFEECLAQKGALSIYWKKALKKTMHVIARGYLQYRDNSDAIFGR